MRVIQVVRKNKRESKKDLINDALLFLDYDTTLIDESSPLWDRAERILDKVIADVLRKRKWSFLREYIHSDHGTTELDENASVIRVIDHWGQVLKLVHNPNPRPGEYYSVAGEVVTGPAFDRRCPGITIEVLNYPIMTTSGKEHVHPKLYDVICMGLAYQLALAPDGFRDSADEKLAEYQRLLQEVYIEDLRETGDGVQFGPASFRRFSRYYGAAW